MTHYIAAGFSNDAEKLLDEFLQTNSAEFPSFAELWKKRNFSAIYLGRDENEITPFTNEIYQITLGFLQNNSFLFQVGAVYLLYALYRNQICVPFVKIRITLPQFDVLKKIQTAAMEKQYQTLLYVIDYLVNHSFDFVANPTLCGPTISKPKVDYNNAVKLASLQRDVKTEITRFRESQALTNLRDLNEKYSDLIQKVFPRETRQSTVNEYDKYIRQLENLTSDKPTSSTKQQATPSKTESAIGSRRAEIKAASFSKRAFFRQLNDSDEDYEPGGEKMQANVRRSRRKHKVPKESRRVGRPKKFNLEELLMNPDKTNENSACEMESPKKANTRGAKKRITFLEEDDIKPTVSPIKFKESCSVTSSDSKEDTSYEETDSESSYSEGAESFL